MRGERATWAVRVVWPVWVWAWVWAWARAWVLVVRR